MNDKVAIKTKKKILHSLSLCVPFLLIPAAVFLLCFGAFKLFISDNYLYKLLTATDNLVADNVSITKNYPSLEEMLAKKEEFVAASTGESEIVAEYDIEVPYWGDEYLYLPTDFIVRRTSDPFPPIFMSEQWATITIPSAGVLELPVYQGTTSDLLDLGAGHSPNSRFPGQGGRIVIPAHVGYKHMFQRLETMNVGDLVYVNTTYAGYYVYRVTETVIIDENDGTYTKSTKDSGDQLVCYTCYPYNTSTVRTQRFVILCELVRGTLYPPIGG